MGHHSAGGDRLDLPSIRAAANLVDIAGRYVELRRAGHEHQALCPFHADGDPSLTIYRGRDGVDRFCCFPCGAKGDALDFVSRIENVDVIEAARIISGSVGPIRHVERLPPPPPKWVPVIPVPDAAPKMNPRELFNPKREGSNDRNGKPYTHTSLKPSRNDEYRDADGRLIGYVLRCEIEGSKWTPTVTFAANTETGETKWALVPFGEPRPLQGLDALAARPAAPVLVVSGEKCRAVAHDLLGQAFAVVTWPGGDNGIGKVDFTPLHSRQVTFWPDADDSGINAMRTVAASLSGASVRFLDVSSLRAQFGKGADIADLAEKMPQAEIVAWARANVATGIPGESRSDQAPEPKPEMPPLPKPKPPAPKTATPAGAGADADSGKGTEPSGETLGKGHGETSGNAANPDTDTTDSGNATAGPQDAGARENDSQQLAAELLDPDPSVTPPKRGRKPKAELVPMPGQTAGAYESLASWSALGLAMSDKGVPHPNLDNAARAIERHAELAGRFWFDEFLQRLLTNWTADGSTREWTDSDDVRLCLWFQRKLGMGKLAVGTARDAVTAVAMAYPRNECREWLESLTWDMTPRLPDLMRLGFGAAPDQDGYAAAVGRCWVVSMVARVLDPGCKVDTMPVFEGAQGLLKSTAIETLVGKRWFAEASKDPTKTDFFLDLVGKLVVEIGELDVFSRAEKEAIKRVISCKVDRYRAPYGRRTEDHPRQSVFAGTTNKDDWNRDETGARRFLPIACAFVDIPWIAAHREQLFAEAVYRFEHHEAWWDVPRDAAKREQESRRHADEWEALIATHLVGLRQVTAGEVMHDALGIPRDRWDKSMQMRVGTCLTSLGWRRVVVWNGSKAARVWRPIDILDHGGKGGNDEPL